MWGSWCQTAFVRHGGWHGGRRMPREASTSWLPPAPLKSLEAHVPPPSRARWSCLQWRSRCPVRRCAGFKHRDGRQRRCLDGVAVGLCDKAADPLAAALRSRHRRELARRHGGTHRRETDAACCCRPSRCESVRSCCCATRPASAVNGVRRSRDERMVLVWVNSAVVHSAREASELATLVEWRRLTEPHVRRLKELISPADPFRPGASARQTTAPTRCTRAVSGRSLPVASARGVMQSHAGRTERRAGHRWCPARIAIGFSPCVGDRR